MGKRANTGGEQASGRRSADGKFRPGVSGNPAGRPPGARNRATLLARQLLDVEGEAIVHKCIDLAKAGDPVALRLCIERIIPRVGQSLEVALPLIRRAEDVATAAAEVISRAAAGEISLAEAKEFMALLNSQRQAIETHDLSVRIEALIKAGDLEPGQLPSRLRPVDE